MITCLHCHQENRPGAFYCKVCGQVLACPRCRVILREPADYCDNCGQALAADGALLYTPATQSGRPVAAEPSPVTHAPERDDHGQTPSDGDPYLEQFVPQELRAKLEAARAGAAMAGERRIVTMLFCDVKGSTAAAQQMDPEDWTEVINGAFEHMIKPVYKYEGTVARLMGDGILAFFGAPIAHEDDPQRAVLAGLDIVAAMKPYREQVLRQYGVDFNVRVGINTGMVVVGTVGSDLRMEYTAMGDAINLAARMEQTAEPGTVQIAHDTYKIVRPLFEFEELGPIEVKGKEAAVLAYRVLGRKATAGRLRGIEGLHSPLVGRDQELASLSEVLSRAQQGVGHIVCIIGEAGLGKSRIINEIKQSNEAQALEWFETSSLSYETAQPYGLFQRLTRRLNNISPGDSAQVVREKLGSLLARCDESEQQRVMQVLDALLGLESSDGQPPLQGETFKRELFQVMPMLWQERFASQPAVIVFDDIHWSDPASIELLLHLLPAIGEIPLVLLCAFRPDREGPVWRIKTTADDQFHHRYTEIKLRPLSGAEVDEQVDHLLTIADLPDRLRERILERSGGNPFFVEEVVRSLIDSGAVEAEERQQNGETLLLWRATEDEADIEIPDNLHALLVARIDRLEEETRQVLQMAAVIGRSFYQRVLEAIQESGNGAGREIQRPLSLLLRMEMIREAARLPELEYKFSNPLTQEVAYQSILRKQRQRFHQRVGEAMEQLFPEQLSEMAPRLAYHFRESGQDERAANYYAMAGDAAYRLYALNEAIDHYNQALALIEPLSADGDQLLHLYRNRGRALELANSYADALENYAEMERLAREREEDSLRLAALLPRTIVHATFTPVFDAELAMSLGEEAISLARRLEDSAAQAKVLWSLMLVHAYTQADNETAMRYGQESLHLTRQHGLDDLLPFILSDLGRISGFNGRIGQGLSLIAEATPLFKQSGNLPLLSDNLNGYSLLSFYAGNYAEALRAAEEALGVSRSINNRASITDSTLLASAAYAELGALGKAVAGIEEGVDREAEMYLYALPFLGHFYAELGKADSMVARLEAPVKEIDKIRFSLRTPILGQMIRLYVRQGHLAAAEQLVQKLAPDLEGEGLQPMDMWGFLAQAELLLAKGEYDAVIALAKEVTAQQEELGIGFFQGDLALIHARSLLALDRPRSEEAKAVLERALVAAKQEEQKRVLWKLLLALAEQVDEEQASQLRQEAHDIVEEIAAGIERPELRQSFLGQPMMKTLAKVS